MCVPKWPNRSRDAMWTGTGERAPILTIYYKTPVWEGKPIGPMDEIPD